MISIQNLLDLKKHAFSLGTLLALSALAILLHALAFTNDATATAPDPKDLGSHPAGKVKIVNDKSELPADLDNEMTHFFSRENPIFDTKSEPGFARHAPKIAELVEQIMLPTDKGQEVRLVFLDSMAPNAFFHRIDQKRILVGITLGALNFVENADQLAAILGHELEHGESQISGSASDRLDTRRSEEIEVDVKSMFRRVLGKGFNPHAWLRLVDKFRSRQGMTFGHSHADWEARGDAMSLALTDQKRTAGKIIPADHPENYKPAVVADLHRDFFHTEAFVRRQNKLWRSKLSSEIDWAKPYQDNRRVVWGAKQGEKRLMDFARSTFGDALLDEQVEFKYRRQAHEGMAAYWTRTYKANYEKALKLETPSDFHAAINFFEARPPMLEKLGLRHLAVTKLKIDNEHSDLFDDEIAEYEKTLRYAKTLFPSWRGVERRMKEYIEVLQKKGTDKKETHRKLAALDAEHLAELPPKLTRMLDRQSAGKAAIRAAGGPFIESMLKNPAKWEKLIDFILYARDYGGVEIPPASRMLELMLESARESAEREGKTSEQKRELLAKLLAQRAFGTIFHWTGSYYATKQPPEVREIMKNALIASSYDDEAFAKAKEALQKSKDSILAEAEPFLKKKPIPGADEVIEKFFSQLGPNNKNGSPEKIRDIEYSGKELDEVARKHDLAAEPLFRRLVDVYAEHFARTERFNPQRVSRKNLVNCIWLMIATGNTPASLDPSALHRSLVDFIHASGSKDFMRIDHERIRIDSRTWYDLVGAKLPIEEAFRKYREVYFVIRPRWQSTYSSDKTPSSFQMTPELVFTRKFAEWMTRRKDLTYGEKRALLDLLKQESNFTGKEVDREHSLEKRYLSQLKSEMDARRAGESAESFLSRVLNESKFLDYYEDYEFSRIEAQLTPHEQWRVFRGLVMKTELKKRHHVFFIGSESGTISVKDPATGLAIKFKRPSIFDHVMTDADFQKNIGMNEISEVFTKFIAGTELNETLEGYFDAWWKHTKENPELRRLFRAEDIRKFRYDADKMRVAEWQLEDRFHLDAEAERVRRQGGATIAKEGVRQIVADLRAFIEVQFPDLGSIRDLLIDGIEAKLATNEAETRLLHEIRTNSQNWSQAKLALATSDLPHLTARWLLKSPLDRLEILEYLVGIEKKNPVQGIRDRQKKASDQKEIEKDEALLDKLRTSFLDSSLPVRTYTLMTLLDKTEGVLADAQTKKRLVRGLLGGRAESALTVALAEAYLEANSAAEKQVLLARISAEKSRVGDRGHVSLAQVLQLMGPLGIKAGQFLLSSGLASPEIREELRNLLNKADPPKRLDLFERLKTLLGKNYSGFTYVGEIVGSGSINYVVRARYFDPRTKRSREVVARVLRSAAEGQAANESELWTRTAEILRQSGDPEQAEMADMIDEARETAMRTLNAGGQELDLRNEEKWHSRIAAAYERDANILEDFVIEVARPRTDMLAGLSDEAKRSIAIYDHIDGVALWDISDKKLRAKLATQILNAELSAIFKHGIFDPDSHLGNWIVDLKRKVLVRIDYSQAVHVDTAMRRQILDFTRLLLKPTWKERDAESLAELFPTAFKSSKPLSQAELFMMISKIAKDTNLPEYDKPQERLFFFRKKIAEMSKSNVSTGSDTQAVFASLGKLAGLSAHISSAIFLGTWVKVLRLDPRNYIDQFVEHLLNAMPFSRQKRCLPSP